MRLRGLQDCVPHRLCEIKHRSCLTKAAHIYPIQRMPKPYGNWYLAANRSLAVASRYMVRGSSESDLTEVTQYMSRAGLLVENGYRTGERG